MTKPTPTQWERFSTLRLRLEPLADDERRDALHAVRSENPDDAGVVSLLALHFAMPETTTQGIDSGDRIDDFVLGERLGAGGMGVVYEATQSLGDASRSVAIKLINPHLWSMAPEQTRNRFADEIKAQAALQYNGLARLYTAGTYEDPATNTQAPYLVMELVHGAQPITDFARERSLDVDEKLQLFQRICRALQHAHDHRIIHRDLKPDNILIDSEGRPFVVDFGLAQTADAALPGATMVTSGTIAYMSPEQLSPEFGPISEKTDTYAMGVVLYELLTGSKPYETSLEDSLERLTQIITVDPPTRPRGDVGMDAELEDIVLKTLSKNPVDRPTIGTLGSQLEHLTSRHAQPSADHIDSSAADGTMWSELRRRGVVRVAAAYAVTAFVALQVAEITFEPLEFPPWAMKSLIVAAAAGFPIAVLLAWAFEKTPAGMVRDKRFEGTAGGRRLAGLLVGVSAAAVGIFGYWLLTHETSTDQAASNKQSDTTINASTESVKPVSPKSIAVLPFANRSPDPENAFFADGMHDGLLTQLSKIADMKVISRTSVMRYADTERAIPDIAKTLGVATIMEGAVQRSGNRVLINVQLIDGTTDEHLWAEIYDRELTTDNIFDIQSEITRAIAAALQSVLTPENESILAERPTQSLAAYDAYLQGMALLDSVNTKSRDEAEAVFKQAITADPDFAAAHAGMARAVLDQYWWTGRSAETLLENAQKRLARAEALAPNAVETLIATGYYHYWGFLDYDRASEFIDRALTKAPNNADVWRLKAFVARRAGRFEESIRAIGKSLELDPLSMEALSTQAGTLDFLGRFDEAHKTLLRWQEVAPESEVVASGEVYVWFSAGDVERACQVTENTKPQPDWTYFYWSEYQCALRRHDVADARRVLDKIPDDAMNLPGYPYNRDINQAWLLEFSGDKEESQRMYLEIEQKLDALENPYPAGWTLKVSYYPSEVSGLLRDLEGVRAAALDFESNAVPDAYDNFFARQALAWAFARAGDFDKAFDYLEQNINVTGYAWYPRVSFDPWFDDLTAHSRFKAMEPEYQKWRAAEKIRADKSKETAQ